MAVSAIFWTTVTAFDTPSDERVLQAPNGASRDRHQCVLAGHLARARARPLAAANDVCRLRLMLRRSSAADAISREGQHPPIRPGAHVRRDCGPRRGGALTAEDPDGFGNGRRVHKPSTNGSPSVLIEFNLPMPKPRKNGARRDSVPRRPEKESPAEAGQGTSWKENQDEAYQHQQRIAAVLRLVPASRLTGSRPRT